MERSQTDLDRNLQVGSMEDDYYGLGKTQFSPDEIAEMMSPELAQRRARERQFKESMANLLAGDGEDNAGPYKLRSIVEHDYWQVPLKNDGSFEIFNARKDEYKRLIAGISKADGRRTDRQGRGGQLLPVHYEKPKATGNYKVLTGRELARTLPEGISGLLIQLDEETELCELGKEHFESLKILADAVEAEDLLLQDGAVNTRQLRQCNFLVTIFKGRPYSGNGPVPVATHEDSTFVNDEELSLKAMRAEELFKAVLADKDAVGIVVNPNSDIGRKGEGIRALALSLNFIALALKEDQCLYRAPEYSARNREEFELWLKLLHFPTPYELIEESDAQGRQFIYALHKQPGADWTILECESKRKYDQVETPRFELKAAPGAADEIAAGESKILCPALLARMLYSQLPERNRKENKWSPGKSLGLCRVLDDEDIEKSALRVKAAREILKMIPPGEDTIPRHKILSVDGATFLTWASYAAQRQWVESAYMQARQFDKKLVFGAK
ncbi:MAG TPA: hypothetical protein PLC15_05965 [Candidatus Obscuribacter sp.]|nr:hypothetical protein [Candidatus Obscuribacter sp.]